MNNTGPDARQQTEPIPELIASLERWKSMEEAYEVGHVPYPGPKQIDRWVAALRALSAPEGTEAPPDEWTEARSRAWYAVVETLYDLGFRYSSEGDRTGLEDVLAFIRELAERPASSPETGNEKMNDVWEVSGHVRVHATGDTLREAVERFLMAYPEADLPEAWEHGEEGGTIIGACEGCDRLLLDEDEYRVVDEDGTRLCPKCVAEETQ